MSNEQQNQIVPRFFENMPVRIVMDENGNPWWVAKDIAEILGYKDTVNAIKQHCKGVVKHHPLQTSGGIQQVRIIAESDLYRLIAKSQLEAAVKFESWIFEEVLPTIRQTGGYGVPALTGSHIDAMVGQIIAMVVPAVTGQVMQAVMGQVAPMVQGVSGKIDHVRYQFGHYSSVSGFVHACCRQDAWNCVILKDELYAAYVEFCAPRQPDCLSHFCSKLYRGVTGVTQASLTVGGKRRPAVRGLSLLPGYQEIIEGFRRRDEESAAREKAQRKAYYFSTPETTEEVEA